MSQDYSLGFYYFNNLEMQQSKLKARINVSNVDTTDRNDEEDDVQPVIEELSPFMTVNRTSLPYGGMSKPNRDSNLLQ